MDGPKRFEYAKCGWVVFFLKNGEKHVRFQKKSGCVWTGPKIQIFFFVVLSWHKCYDFLFIHRTSSSLECKKQKHYCLPKCILNNRESLIRFWRIHRWGRTLSRWLNVTTFISQPIVIACSQQAWNNHWIVACAGQTIFLVLMGWRYFFTSCFLAVSSTLQPRAYILCLAKL